MKDKERIEAAATCRNIEHELGEMIEKLRKLPYVAGVIETIANASAACKECADLLYGDEVTQDG